MSEKKEKGLAGKGDTLPADTPPQEQLLNERAEEYLRESGNIEDLPDQEQAQEAEKQIKKIRQKTDPAGLLLKKNAGYMRVIFNPWFNVTLLKALLIRCTFRL